MEHLPKSRTAPRFLQEDNRLVFPENAVYVRPIKDEERTPECDDFKYIVHSEDGNRLGLISDFEHIEDAVRYEEKILYFAH